MSGFCLSMELHWEGSARSLRRRLVFNWLGFAGAALSWSPKCKYKLCQIFCVGGYGIIRGFLGYTQTGKGKAKSFPQKLEKGLHSKLYLIIIYIILFTSPNT